MRYLPVVPLLVILASTSAAAQGVESHRLSIGAAAGISNPLHGDFDFTAPAWQADVRLNMGRFVASTIFVEQWQRTNDEVRTDIPILGPGPIGRIDRLVSRTTQSTRVVGWSLLAKSNGRIAMNGGGGVSYLLYSRESTTTTEGCTPATLCGTTSSEFDNSAFAAQLQAGVDIRIVRRLAVMGLYRLVVPIEDPGSGHGTIVGGIRLLF